MPGETAVNKGSFKSTVYFESKTTKTKPKNPKKQNLKKKNPSYFEVHSFLKKGLCTNIDLAKEMSPTEKQQLGRSAQSVHSERPGSSRMPPVSDFLGT